MARKKKKRSVLRDFSKVNIKLNIPWNDKSQGNKSFFHVHMYTHVPRQSKLCVTCMPPPPRFPTWQWQVLPLVSCTRVHTYGCNFTYIHHTYIHVATLK